MFTIKLYNGDRQKIMEAEGFTILHGEGGDAEITLHRPRVPSGEYNDVRYDISGDEQKPDYPEVFGKAIIENSMGKTTEIITAYARKVT